MSPFRVLTFDCYGTLIDWERGVLAHLRPWANRRGLALDADALLEAFGAEETACQQATPGKRYPEILADVFAALGRRWSVAVSKDEAHALGASIGSWPPFPDTPPALQYLAGHFTLVVLSNVDRASFAATNRQLGVEFARVLTAEEIGSYKPDERNFLYAMREMGSSYGVGKDGILHVAQSVYHDIIPAKALGLATAWVNRRRGRPGWGATPAPKGDAAAVRPDFEVESLAALVTLHQQGNLR